ncbi:MAG: FkbM family methyltransferase [Luteolibacter sp.]
MSTVKKAIKHLLGRDLWIRSDDRIATRFYGSRYGGWSIVEGTVGKGSVVYSFGIGEDASFDLGLIAAAACTVHGFDPTPKSLGWVEKNVHEERFVMHPWALGSEDGTLTLWMPDNPDHVSASLVSASGRSKGSFDAECKSLESVMKELGHERVDVMKMDIEGAEYGVIEALCADGAISKVGQLLVEFHHRMEGFTKAQTLSAIKRLRNEGFRIAWVSEVGHEVLFVRRSD